MTEKKQQHTPEEWERGHFIDCKQYEEQSAEWKKNAEYEESKRIFANFHESDQGRSRVLICVLSDFDTDANGDLIAAAPRTARQRDKLLGILRSIEGRSNQALNVISSVSGADGDKLCSIVAHIRNMARAAIPAEKESNDE
jgi:hypothetical protein